MQRRRRSTSTRGERRSNFFWLALALKRGGNTNQFFSSITLNATQKREQQLMNINVQPRLESLRQPWKTMTQRISVKNNFNSSLFSTVVKLLSSYFDFCTKVGHFIVVQRWRSICLKLERNGSWLLLRHDFIYSRIQSVCTAKNESKLSTDVVSVPATIIVFFLQHRSIYTGYLWNSKDVLTTLTLSAMPSNTLCI